MITLKQVMRANAASCIVFGCIFLTIPADVTSFLSTNMPAPETILLLLGIVLIVNGLHLILVSLQPKPGRLVLLYFSIGDYIWVIASISLIFLGIWVTTPEGIFTTLAVSLMVGWFGVMQMYLQSKSCFISARE